MTRELYAESSSDAAEIRELLIKYATAIDARRRDLFREVFLEFATAEYEPSRAAASAGVAKYTSEADLAQTMTARHAELDSSLHRITNTVIEELTTDTALARSYVDALLIRRSAPGGPVLRIYGIYEDCVVRTADGWRIAHRHFRPLLTEGNEGVL